LQQYFTGTLNLQNELQEDALLSIVCMLGKIQKDNKIPKEQRYDVCYVLDMITQTKWKNILFQRRFVHILIQWVKLIPKSKFIFYYYQVLDNLNSTTDFVLIYEYATCIHEMLKELDYWIKMSNSSGPGQLVSPFGVGLNTTGLRKATVKGDLLDFNDN